MRLMKRMTKTRNNKSTAVLSPSLLVCAFMSACSATVEDDGIKISPNPAETEQEKITMQEPEVQ